jgi:hypothetical protein
MFDLNGEMFSPLPTDLYIVRNTLLKPERDLCKAPSNKPVAVYQNIDYDDLVQISWYMLDSPILSWHLDIFPGPLLLDFLVAFSKYSSE